MSNEFVEKDSKLGFIVVIIVLLLVVFGLGGYIIYDNYMVKDEEVIEDASNDKVEDVVRELSASEVSEYLEKIKVYNYYFYDNYLVKASKTITNGKYLSFASRILEKEGKTVTVSDVKDVLEKYFGKNNNVKIEDIHCEGGNEVLYEYDLENDIYIKKEHIGHGGLSGLDADVNYVTSSVSLDKVSVIVKNIYPRYCSDICGPIDAYYGSVEDMFNRENALATRSEGEDELELTDSLKKELLEEVPEITYNFIIEESGNFYLDSVSINK